MSNQPSKDEILKVLSDRDVARMCGNCATWDRCSSRCPKYNKITQSFMFCPSHEFEWEAAVREEKEFLSAEQKERNKIEAVLAMALTTATLSSVFIEDFIKRTRRFYENEKEKQIKLWLRKDMNLGEEIQKAMEKIEQHLEKIDQQYRFYVQANLDRMFTKDKKLDIYKTDGHLANSMDLGRLLINFTRKCIGNDQNYNLVFAFLDALENETPYPLTDQDAARYKLKM